MLHTIILSIMETKTSTVRARIAPKLKKDAEDILETLGLTTTQAITLFFNQIILHKGLPLDLQIHKTAKNEAPLKKEKPLEKEEPKNGFLFFGRNKKK